MFQWNGFHCLLYQSTSVSWIVEYYIILTYWLSSAETLLNRARLAIERRWLGPSFQGSTWKPSVHYGLLSSSLDADDIGYNSCCWFYVEPAWFSDDGHARFRRETGLQPFVDWIRELCNKWKDARDILYMLILCSFICKPCQITKCNNN